MGTSKKPIIIIKDVIHKKCTKCDQLLLLDCFYKQKNGQHGVRSSCAKCEVKTTKEYRSTDKAKRRHADLEKIRRDKKKANDPFYHKKIYQKYGAKQNEYRKNKYWSDDEYRKNKLINDRKRVFTESYKKRLQDPDFKKKSIIKSRDRRLKPEKKKMDYERTKEWRDGLPDSYIVNMIHHNHGIPKELITKDIVEQNKKLIKRKREYYDLNNKKRPTRSTNNQNKNRKGLQR